MGAGNRLCYVVVVDCDDDDDGCGHDNDAKNASLQGGISPKTYTKKSAISVTAQEEKIIKRGVTRKQTKKGPIGLTCRADDGAKGCGHPLRMEEPPPAPPLDRGSR